LPVLTDGLGRFSALFNPLPGEAGRYQVFATHPGVPSVPAQCEFVLAALRFIPSSVAHALSGTQAQTNQVRLTNLCDLEIGGLHAVTGGAPTGVTVQVNVPANLPASGSVAVDYVIESLVNQAWNGTL